VYYNAEGEQFVEDSFYFISNQHLPPEVQTISSHLFPNPPGAEYASLGAVYLGNTKLYKLSDIVPYLNGTAEDLPIQSPCYAKRIWSFPHSYDSESSLLFSVTVPELGNAVIEQKEDGKVYINNEKFLGGLGYGCESFYLADVNGDSKPELCFGTMFGSGIINSSIEIFDFETKKCIFYLSDRMNYDYHLFVRNGVLCVKEIEYMKAEVNRTGMLIHDGTQVSVLWDSEVNATPDRDTSPAS
jgi:hypothetical protein